MAGQVLRREQMGAGLAAASLLSVELTETLFRDLVEPDLEQAFQQFFYGDPQVRLVCRKIVCHWVQDQVALYHAALEQARQQRCTQATFVVTSSWSAKLLDGWRLRQTIWPQHAIQSRQESQPSAWRWWQPLIGHGIVAAGLVWQVLTQCVRQGLCVRVRHRAAPRIGFHDYWTVTGRPNELRSADFLADGDRVQRSDLLLVISGKGPEAQRIREYDHAGLRWARLCGPPMVLSDLLRLIPRLARLVGALCRTGQSPHPPLRRGLTGAVRYGIQLETFLRHSPLRVLLNAEEHAYHHIIETIVLNHTGGRTTWVPYTAFTTAGAQTAYLHYDLFPVQGWFPVSIYGQTWSRRMQVTAIGMPSNDSSRMSDDQAASEPVRRLLVDRQPGETILAAFTGSYTPDVFVMERNRRFLLAIAELARRPVPLRIILKPKANEEWPEHSRFLFTPPFWDILEPGVRAQRIAILDPTKQLTCTAQYLIQQADAVMSTGQYAAFGSVWIEALLLGKPSYVFTPSEFRVAPFAAEFFDQWRLMFDEESALVNAVIASLHRPVVSGTGSEGSVAQDVEAIPATVVNRVRQLFDPFTDGHAITRFRDAVVAMIQQDQLVVNRRHS